jgi:DNA replication and repair protein RecF
VGQSLITATSRAPFDRTLDFGAEAHRALAVERADGAAAVTTPPAEPAPPASDTAEPTSSSP